MSLDSAPDSRAPTVISAVARQSGLKEMWRSRELVRFLAWRDVQVRYKQTAFGAAWAILQPLVAMLIFTIVFGRLAKLPSDGVPYSVFAYAGLVPWTYFSVSLGSSANSLVEGQALLTKVYFPRLFIPAAPVLANLVDLAIASCLLVIFALLAGLGLGPSILALPLLVAALAITTFAFGLTLSAVNVRYRDVRFALPFLIQVWLFATPVVYPSSLLTPGWRLLFGLNPMSGLVEAVRWSVLGTRFPGLQLGVSLITTAVALILGTRYFRRVQSTFADVV